MRQFFFTLSICVLLATPVAGLTTNLPSTEQASSTTTGQEISTDEADRESLWQQLQQWHEKKKLHTVQPISPFEQLRQQTGKDFISDGDIEQQIQIIENELALLNKELAPAAHYSQVIFYHSIIELLSRIELLEPLVWQMMTAFLAGDDAAIFKLPYDKESFHTALDYLQAALRIRIIVEPDSAIKESVQKLLSIVASLKNDPEGIVTLHLEEESPLKPLLVAYQEDPLNKISMELHSFLSKYLGENLYQSLFPGQNTIATPDSWLSLQEKIISLDAEYRQLLLHLIDKAVERGNTLIADNFSPAPFVDFPGNCARDADFTFTVKFGCWCDAENRWTEETRSLQPLNQNGDLLMENNRRFSFDINDATPASTCRPCYGILQYEMNNYCETNSLKGSLFWGAVVQ